MIVTAGKDESMSLLPWPSDWLEDKFRAGPMHCKWHRADIAVRACQKDRVAFSLLYEYYKRPFGRRLMALVNNQETVKDLYQDTFVRAWQYASPAVADYFERWLYNVARNLAIDYIRHACKLETASLSSELILTEAEGRVDWTSHEDRLLETLQIEQIIARMSPQYRICLLLQHQWGFKQSEIAAKLDISEKTVSANVSRAYKQLKLMYLHPGGTVVWEVPVELWEMRTTMTSELDFLKGPSPRLQQLWEAEDRHGSMS